MPFAAKPFRPHGDKPKRPSRSKEGYGRDWQKFREWYASEVPPICVKCGAALPSRDMHLDHIEPITGIDDPRRLDPTNVEWLCRSCHSRKTCIVDGGFSNGG